MKVNLLLVSLFSVIFILFQAKVSGQSFCGNTGGFTITPSEGCAPLTVSVSNLVPKAENITYAFNFDRARQTVPDTRETTQDSSYTYIGPGTYTILQFGSAGGTGFSQCKDITVLETRAPNASLTRCASGKALLTILNDSISKAYDFLDVNWGDGQRQSVELKNNEHASLTHNYTANNFSAATVTGRYSNGQCQQGLNSISLTGQSSQPLDAVRIRSVDMQTSGEAKIIYDGLKGTPTELLIDEGDGNFIATGKKSQTGGTQAVSVTGLDPAKSYRFKLSSLNICDEVVESSIVSSIVLKQEPVALDEIVFVSWAHLANTDNLVEYQLKRNNAVIFSSSTQLFYQDTDVRCGNSYEYEVVAVIENDVRSYSQVVTIEPTTSAPETIAKASVTVEDSRTISTQVELSGVGLTSSYNLMVERALLGSNDFQLVSPAANQTLQFKDAQVNADQNSYCYRFEYENACKLRSPGYSQPVCSILLRGGSQDVYWTTESPFTSGVGFYDLIEMRQDGSIQDEIPVQLSNSYALDLNAPPVYGFRIKAHSADQSLESFSNILNFSREAIIQVPDAFTPNGDAYNERFEIKGYFITNYHLSIFNRWGEVVFSSDDIANSWDGNVKSGKAPGGYYLYKLELTDSSGQKTLKEGSFLLIR